jgi:carboxymethylenebutenolidase
MPDPLVKIDTADGPMPAYEVTPDGAAKGGVVVVQEAFGVTRHIEEIAERLGAAGWHALAPALFHRQGSPVFSYDDLTPVMPAMQQLTAAGIRLDISASIEHLEAAGFPPARQGIVGFCMGGSVTFYSAVDHAVGAAVTFYGGGIAEGRFGYGPQVAQAANLQTPWLGLFGDLDRGIPPEQVEALRAAAAPASVPTDVVRYADADHGFNCNDRPAVYNEAAAGDAWSRTLAWFDAHIGAR